VESGKPSESPRAPRLRPEALLELLAKHNVDYVVIGGVGANIWGSPRGTLDLDICAATTRANKRRLASALTDLDAHFRPAGLEQDGFAPPGGWDDHTFDSLTSLATTTSLGWLDIWFIPDGTTGYNDLIQTAADVRVGEYHVKVAAIADIIRSKQATGRNKDLAALDHLRELAQRRAERGQTEP
jgi:hypothetical protein